MKISEIGGLLGAILLALLGSLILTTGYQWMTHSPVEIDYWSIGKTLLYSVVLFLTFFFEDLVFQGEKEKSFFQKNKILITAILMIALPIIINIFSKIFFILGMEDTASLLFENRFFFSLYFKVIIGLFFFVSLIQLNRKEHISA